MNRFIKYIDPPILPNIVTNVVKNNPICSTFTVLKFESPSAIGSINKLTTNKLPNKVPTIAINNTSALVYVENFDTSHDIELNIPLIAVIINANFPIELNSTFSNWTSPSAKYGNVLATTPKDVRVDAN
ncbi:MAG: hypothetical protein IIT65_16010, partial [Lachnospiraceae bacterium]|nr:hypothetical protein [Lachnospiraceae bacterium]